MKTLEEVYEHIAKESGYNTVEAMFEEIKEDVEVMEFYIRMISREYAEQSLEEAADKAIEMSYEVPNTEVESKGLVLRTFKICYATAKQTILSIKEQLK